MAGRIGSASSLTTGPVRPNSELACMRTLLSTHAKDYHSGMDPYAILGVAQSADEETIRSVYRQLARTFHPDVNADAEAVEHFHAITDAYVLLTDPERRAEYDCRQADRPIGSETSATLGLQVAGIDLASLLGISRSEERRVGKDVGCV